MLPTAVLRRHRPRVNQTEIVHLLRELRQEHRDLDVAIQALVDSRHPDEMAVRRLKQRKLRLKDLMSQLESDLIPDLDA